MDSDDRRSNPSKAEPLGALLTRRQAMKGMAAGAALAAGGCGIFGSFEGSAPGTSTLGFETVPSTLDDRGRVAAGYRSDVVIRWGDPVLADAPAFDTARLSPEAQDRQFGYNPDFLAFLPLPRGSKASDHGLL